MLIQIHPQHGDTRELQSGILSSPRLFVVSFIRTAQLGEEGGRRKEEEGILCPIV